VERARQRGLTVLTVGPGGDTIDLKERKASPLGQTLVLGHGGKDWTLKLPLIGAYQAANVLAAAGLVLATGGAWADTLRGLGRLSPVRGRLERAVITPAGAPVYVDYAHTPDALEAAIAALKPHVEGRLITLFGAGGDRDVGKRPEMGRVAAEGSDVVIVTDDNPRTEDPAAIRRAVLAGAPRAKEIGGRREAIAAALAEARDGDIVLLAGKGHETVQVIGDKVLPFDDAEIARECAA
jgi:UDP-N-acetylmuramoyl-L-alanyl-D-glutamate--2,6-diaminopimelate ligase